MSAPRQIPRARPRKTALVRALARAGAPAATAAPVTRPAVDFADPLLRHAALQASGIGLCAFLVTLAAFQRGLRVTFHYERASADPRFANVRPQGHRGELFSIADGRRTHYFLRTLGDLTDPSANAVAEDKHLTKQALARGGVATPAGIVVLPGQRVLVERFLARRPAARFVVKPHAGSMGRDVHADLPADQVCAAVDRIGQGRILVEEFVTGTEYRVFVAAGRAIASIVRDRPHVVGDGHATVSQLIERKNALRAANPRLRSNLIKDMDDIAAHLAAHGLTLASMPAGGQRVDLLGVASISRGGDPVDTTITAPAVAHEVAIRACRAIGLVIAGVDLIVSGTGADARAHVLELNQRPHIGSHSFPMDGPGQGNAVAEAIVDHYFPDSITAPARPRLVYDFAPVRTALEGGQLAEVALPVVGPDWKLLRFTESGTAADVLVRLMRTAAQATGCYLTVAPAGGGVTALCLAAAPANFRTFLSLLPVLLRRRLLALDTPAS